MTSEKRLTEIALNRREITHPTWGSFIIKRSTTAVIAEIESAKTRSRNIDLQTREIVTDPETKQLIKVPAYLTRAKKRSLLIELGDWSKDKEEAIKKASEDYTKSCVELDKAGFVGLEEMELEYEEAITTLKDLLGEKLVETLEKELFVLSGGIDEELSYLKARKTVESKAKNIKVSQQLNVLDEVNKQASLVKEAIAAQANLYALKIEELTYFSDTIESRADNAANLTKILRCVSAEDGAPLWANIDELSEEDPKKIGYLLEQIEKFERLDPLMSSEDIKRREKFNFLFRSQDLQEYLEHLREAEKSKQDGQLAEKTQESSTEDLEPQPTN